MEVEQIIEGVTVCGRLEYEDGLQWLQLIEPYGQLSASVPTDTSSGRSSEALASDLLNQLYLIAGYVYENQALLRDILERVLRKIESRSGELGVSETALHAEIVRQEVGRYFESAFPMPVPEDCWAQLLNMIGSSLG